MTPTNTIARPGLPGWMQALPLKLMGEMAVPIAVLAIVIALITPLPVFVVDLLIVIDILLSVTVLMVSLYLVRPVEFTSFPTTLLLLTLFRLALNISSSRLILLNGNTGTSAAGEVGFYRIPVGRLCIGDACSDSLAGAYGIFPSRLELNPNFRLAGIVSSGFLSRYRVGVDLSRGEVWLVEP